MLLEETMNIYTFHRPELEALWEQESAPILIASGLWAVCFSQVCGHLQNHLLRRLATPGSTRAGPPSFPFLKPKNIISTPCFLLPSPSFGPIIPFEGTHSGPDWEVGTVSGHLAWPHPDFLQASNLVLYMFSSGKVLIILNCCTFKINGHFSWKT